MSVAVRDLMGWGMWRRRDARRTAAVGERRRPVAPVSRPWEGAAAVLRAALIMASGLLLSGVIGWLWATLTDPHVLPIRRLEIEGSFIHVNEQNLRAAVTPYLKGNLLTVDVRQVQRVVQALSWVRDAEVRRVWPDAIHLTVREQEAVALWGNDALINDAGEVFQPPRKTYPQGLARLQGPDGSGKAVVTSYLNMSHILAPLGVHILALHLDQRRAWGMELDNGMQLMLGRSDGEERLLRFVRFYHRALRGREAEVRRVDLRYSNGFAVSWKGNAMRSYKAIPEAGESSTQ